MNRFAVLTASLLAVTSLPSFASPQLYSFSAPIYASEVNLDGSDIADDDLLFNAVTSISGTFYYDAAAAATATNQSPTDSGPTGLYSAYEGSIQNLTATVGGYSFSAATASTLVGDSNDDSTLDTVFVRAGAFDTGNVGSGFSTFTIDGYQLVSFELYTFSPASTLGSQALPAILSNGEIVTAVSLVFADENNQQRLVQFGLGNIELTEVPLPASAWLFGSAALILVGRKRTRA